MHWLSKIRLFWRASKRLGAFNRALKNGATVEEARAYSDTLYPPNSADLEYEGRLEDGSSSFPWPSAVSLLVPFFSMIFIATIATAETGVRPALGVIAGYGISQLAYIMLAFGLVAGRFGIFGIEGRWRVIGIAVVIFVLSIFLVNSP